MHPLVQDLSNLSLDELQSKYSDLTKKFLQAQKSGNGNLTHQIMLIIDDYRNEINLRQQKLLDDANKNSNFKNIIDIS
jgi:predicted Zn-dependent protease